jgi:hypothetical protein
MKNALNGKRKGTNVVLCGVIMCVLLTVAGCNKLRRIEIDKDGKKPFCAYVNEENIDKTIPITNEFLKTLSDDLDEEQKLQELVTWLKLKSCIVDANIFCVSCVKTGIPHSEVFVSFEENGVTKELSLCILMSSPLKAVRYHELFLL